MLKILVNFEAFAWAFWPSPLPALKADLTVDDFVLTNTNKSVNQTCSYGRLLGT